MDWRKIKLLDIKIYSRFDFDILPVENNYCVFFDDKNDITLEQLYSEHEMGVATIDRGYDGTNIIRDNSNVGWEYAVRLLDIFDYISNQQVIHKFSNVDFDSLIGKQFYYYIEEDDKWSSQPTKLTNININHCKPFIFSSFYARYIKLVNYVEMTFEEMKQKFNIPNNIKLKGE